PPSVSTLSLHDALPIFVIAGRESPAEPAQPAVPVPMQDDDPQMLRAELERLRQEHRDLDAAIEALGNVPGRDLIQLQRLKKRKLDRKSTRLNSSHVKIS